MEIAFAADIQAAGLTKGLKEAIQKDLRLTLFVAGDVVLAPRGKCGEFVPVQHSGGFTEKPRRCQQFRLKTRRERAS
jgi:hypothetical protein